MQYQTPEVVEVASAITSVRSEKEGQPFDNNQDASPAYEDWE